MQAMNFSTQICTTREQSEKLLALGLKKETADMTWHCASWGWELRPYRPTTRETLIKRIGEKRFEEIWGKDIPAWSLHRLIALFCEGSLFSTIDLVLLDYGCMIDAIESKISMGKFNKEYLEERS